MSSAQTDYEDDDLAFWRDRFTNHNPRHTRLSHHTEVDTGRSPRRAPKRVVTIDDFRGRPNGYIPRKPGPPPSRSISIVNGVIVKEPNDQWPSVQGNSAPASPQKRTVNMTLGLWESPRSSALRILAPSNSPSPVRPCIRPPRPPPLQSPVGPPAWPSFSVAAKVDPTLEEMFANPSLYRDPAPLSYASHMRVLRDALPQPVIEPVPDISFVDQDDCIVVDQRSKDGGSRGDHHKDDRRRRKAERKQRRAERQKRRARRSGPGATKENPIEIEDDSETDAALTTTNSRASSCTLDGESLYEKVCRLIEHLAQIGRGLQRG